MILQSLTICVKYADFLLHTLSENSTHFDKWIVVTTPDDIDTINECGKYQNVKCVTTNNFYLNGAAFAKHEGYNVGLSFIDPDAFIIFIDADIVLQPETRHVLNALELEAGLLYGVDRIACNSFVEWQDYKNGKLKGLVEHDCMVGAGSFSLMPRLAHRHKHIEAKEDFEGYKPLGYFQLTHRSSFGNYPGGSEDAASSDVAFARLFTRRKTRLIAELVCIHIDSLPSPTGSNWKGRKTPYFGQNTKHEYIEESRYCHIEYWG